MNNDPPEARAPNGRATAVLLTFAALISPFAGSSVLAGPGRVPAALYVDNGNKDLARNYLSNAILNYRRALAEDSRNVPAYDGLGRAYLRLGDKVRAQESYREALKIDPHNSEAEDGLHDAMSEAEHEQYYLDVEAAARAQPTNPDVLTTYAEELLERNKVAEAEAVAERAVQQSGKVSHAECVLGRIALLQHRAGDALKYLTLATRGDSGDDDAFAALGDLYLQEKDSAGAVRCYQNAVKAAPEHREWHQKLLAGYMAEGDTAAAGRESAVLAKLQSEAQAASTAPAP